jgi:hypothetical protein
MRHLCFPTKGFRRLEEGSVAGSAFKYCDLVMKGGITSGIVYPFAALEL